MEMRASSSVFFKVGHCSQCVAFIVVAQAHNVSTAKYVYYVIISRTVG